MVFASTARRFSAYILDTLVIGLLSVLIYVIALVVLWGRAAIDWEDPSSVGVIELVLVVVSSAITFLYFVWSWTHGPRGTLGMRLFRLQVGNAFDGRPLSSVQAIRRWIAMGFPLALLAVIPALSRPAELANLLLEIVLLLTTIGSQAKQGLHDKFANSAVVEPVGAGFASILGCMVLAVAIILLMAVIVIVALIFIGSQVNRVQTAVGWLAIPT